MLDHDGRKKISSTSPTQLCHVTHRPGMIRYSITRILATPYPFIKSSKVLMVGQRWL